MGKASKGLLDDEDVAAQDEDANLSLSINPEYAARLEHNKQREEWHRLKEKNPRLAAKIEAKAAGGEEVESDTEKAGETSDEDDDEDELAEQAKIDERFLNVLSKIRQKDQSIYDSTAQLYPESDSDSDGEGRTTGKRPSSRRAHLKDVLAKQALEGHEGSSSENDEGAAELQAQGPTYVQEQQQLRQAFLQEVERAEGVEGEGQDEFGGVLRRRGRAADASEPQAQAGADAGNTQKLLNEYFGADDAQLGEGWLDKDDEGYEEYAAVDDEDEEYIEKAERFESQYNHRFEEPGGGNMVTYPRQLEGVVRKQDGGRRATREARAQRKATEAVQEEQQVKRMKSAKRREIDDRLSRIKAASGSEVAERLLKEIMGKADFDMEEYDKAMAAAFDDQYYEEKDPDLDEGGTDEEADAEPMLDSLPEIEEDGEEAEEMDEDIDVGAEKTELIQLADEYSRMDAEDIVGGVRTRFRYREVPAVDYGLNILDILRAPEKELNQVVGMKRLAPYREDAGRFRPNMAKLKEMQSAAEAAGQRAKKGSLQRTQKQGFERERSHRRNPELEDGQQPAQTGSDDMLPSSSEPAPRKQKQAGVKKGYKKSAGTQRVQETTAGQLETSAKPRAEAPDNQKAQQKKRKAASSAAAVDEGPAEQGAAAAGEPVVQKKRKRPGQDDKGVHEQTAEEKAQSRLASFAKPTLAAPAGSSDEMRKRKKKVSEQPAAAVPDKPEGPKLTKAQRKNMWRAKKRALQQKSHATA